MAPDTARIIDEIEIGEALESARAPEPSRVRELLARARELRGLGLRDVALLSRVEEPELLEELFAAARAVKEQIYGPRLVLFAPLYVSNLCCNDCSYCAFSVKNKALCRRALSREELAHEVGILIDQGHKRLLLVSGEAYPEEGFDYIINAIETLYSVKRGAGEIRRVNVNVAPLTLEQFQALKGARIGTYQLFQESYHRPTYAANHRAGPKKNFDWRLQVMDRAMSAGIDDVGIGVLFGLYDWRFELLALMQHAAHLERTFGAGPHTISVPRIEPAEGSPLAESPPHAVTDDDFKKIVAILRLAVPYTGLILSTRESAETRREVLALGISQISAGSRTDPGGYAEHEEQGGHEAGAQFQLGDHRSLDEVIRDVASLGYVPSFCTGCYRMGRTGKDFMDLAKPGAIKAHCDPNALSTFTEYLMDYASPETRAIGTALIERSLAAMAPAPRAIATKLVERVRQGKRDLFV